MSIGITIIYLPLMLGVFLPDVQIPMGHLLVKLSLTIVAPLLLGLFIKSRFEKIAHTAEKCMHMISRVFVILLTLVVLLLYYKQFIGLFGTYAILAGVIYIIASFWIGYLLGWPERGTMLAMGFMHGARNASVAVMVAWGYPLDSGTYYMLWDRFFGPRTFLISCPYVVGSTSMACCKIR